VALEPSGLDLVISGESASNVMPTRVGPRSLLNVIDPRLGGMCAECRSLRIVLYRVGDIRPRPREDKG
jgi:hypothetical protein